MKQIRSWLHNLGHSLTSDTNYIVDGSGKHGSFFSNLVSEALQSSSQNELTVQLKKPYFLSPLSCKEALREQITRGLQHYAEYAPRMASDLGVDYDKIVRLEFALSRREPPVNGRVLICIARCTTDDGRDFAVEINPTR